MVTKYMEEIPGNLGTLEEIHLPTKERVLPPVITQTSTKERVLPPSIAQIRDIYGGVIETETSLLEEYYIDAYLQHLAAASTLTAFRSLRGKILFSNGSLMPKIYEYLSSRTVEQQQEVNEVASQAKKLATGFGELFWTKKKLDTEKKYQQLESLLDDALTDRHYLCSRYNSSHILETWRDILIAHHTSYIQKSENLGNSFTFNRKPHPWLDKIPVSDLKNFSGDGGTVILAAPLSSGLLGAGVVAHYLNNELNIKTEIDPLFLPGIILARGVYNKNEIPSKHRVIPFLQYFQRTGWTSAVVLKVIQEKYEAEKVYLNEAGNEAKEMIPHDSLC